MKTDTQLKNDVTAELTWDKSLNANEIGVEVKDGIVTLTGHVDHYFEKWAAERATQKVLGVKALAVEIDVKLPGSSNRNDADIAKAVKNVLEWTSNLPRDQIKVMVEKGWITLSGQVDFEFQRKLALSCVRNLMGVTGVSNSIMLKPQLSTGGIKTIIEAALNRRAINDSKKIIVKVDGGKVDLSGVVHSWSEREMVSDSVWNTPGVSSVNNNISVIY